MRAIIKTNHGEGHLEVGEWPEPTPAPDEIKLRVGYAGICGTDIHIIEGEWPCRPPVVLGHEFCGTAVEVGALVRDSSLVTELWLPTQPRPAGCALTAELATLSCVGNEFLQDT